MFICCVPVKGDKARRSLDFSLILFILTKNAVLRGAIDETVGIQITPSLPNFSSTLFLIYLFFSYALLYSSNVTVEAHLSLSLGPLDMNGLYFLIQLP